LELLYKAKLEAPASKTKQKKQKAPRLERNNFIYRLHIHLHREKIYAKYEKIVVLVKDNRTCLEFDKVEIQINLQNQLHF
jgi:hypothetical protein